MRVTVAVALAMSPALAQLLKRRRGWRLFAIGICGVLALAASMSFGPSGSVDAGAAVAPPPNFKVAIIGDQGIGANAEAVLQLISDESADMVIHLGDFGYGNESDPQTAIDWDAQITSILGADFPYFGAVGNHDFATWTTYQQLLEDRLALVSGASCIGNYGVESTCTYQGLFFILSGVGTHPSTPKDDPAHLSYLATELSADDSIWSICAWHKNQNAMQLGTLSDEVGWGAYETCKEGGAIIATGHEHSYSRTRTLIDMENQTVSPSWPSATEVGVAPGMTFAVVSGLAGLDIRNQDRCLPITPPYGCNGEWASIYTSDQGARYGALFIEFHIDGDPRKATAYFKDVNENVADTFAIYAATPKLTGNGDTDGDGCSDERENGPNPLLGGQRNYLNPWDFYDVLGPGATLPTDGVIDLPNDVLGVIQHFSPTGAAPYDVQFDRGPQIGTNAWNMTAPDGVIDLANDVLGVILQFNHRCA